MSACWHCVLPRSAGLMAPYTPCNDPRTMIAWLRTQGKPVRVVDPGAGSGRFILAAGAAFDNAQLIAVETDPLAGAGAAHQPASARHDNAQSSPVDDYRRIKLPKIAGMTAFVATHPMCVTITSARAGSTGTPATSRRSVFTRVQWQGCICISS